MENDIRIDKYLWAIRVFKTRSDATDAWRLLGNRVGASLVPEYAEDITPEEERAKLEAPHENIFLHRDRGTGRPTKKDRRILDKIMAGFD